jgi:hypothetical protein
VTTVFSTIGAGVQKRVNEAQVYVQLTHKSERRISQTAIMHAARRRLGAIGIGFDDLAVEEVPLFNMPSGRHAQIMYAVRGPDIDVLQRHTHNLVAIDDQFCRFIPCVGCWQA